MNKQVVIVGGGFGGLRAARALRSASVDVTLVDRRNYHLFQPLLYQVATGSLSAGDIAAPLRGVLGKQRNATVLLGDVVDFDAAARRVRLADGAELPYDALIVAAGTRSSYYGHEEWREWAPSLKSIEEATDIRHKILYAFEVAERIADPQERAAWLNFVVVGAGPTGVELAGAIAEIARHTLKNDFRSINPGDARISLIDGAPRVLPMFPEDLSSKAASKLEKLGVEVRTGVMVKAIDREGLDVGGPEGPGRMNARTVLWAGGVGVSPVAKKLAAVTHAETDKMGRIKVLPDLTIPGHPEIFVVGDLACSLGRDGKPLPGVAQVAMQQGTYAAKTIVSRSTGRAPLAPFRYVDKGSLAVIGRWAAVANAFGVQLSGFLAWLVWALIHIMYLVQFQSRVVVFIKWMIQDLTFNRGSRLMTGGAADFRVERERETAQPVGATTPRAIASPSSPAG
jgi:NADH:ubiquinone reductase (H+-translocating)